MRDQKQQFKTLYAKHADEIFRFLYMHVRDEDLAEDLAADTFTKAWQNLERFDFRHPRAWLYTIARNRLTDHWRKGKTLPLDEDVEIVDTAEPIGDRIDRAITNERLMDAIATLPEPSRSVIIQRFVLGESVRGAAEALGLTEANVRVVQYRALKKLKDVL